MARFKRFQYNKQSHTDIKIFLSVAVFVIILIIFYAGFSSISEKTHKRQHENLQNALNRSIAHYYATNGHYPADLAELKSNYYLMYDEDTFFVDYRLQGDNIFPDVTIIEEAD